jgi:protein tyrosine phosphatase
VSIIVMLSQMSDFCYWPLDEFTYKNYSVKLVSQVSNQSNEYLVTRQLQVSKLSRVIDTPHNVTLYQFLPWIDQIIPETTFPLIELCETVLSGYETNSPILVHCRNGSQRSGIFISLLSLIQQIKVDKRVDVFQTARWTKLQRCSMFQCFVSFTLIKNTTKNSSFS